MSSTKETYMNIGSACVSKIEDTFNQKVKDASVHKNKIIQLNYRVEHLCNFINKKKINTGGSDAIQKMIHLNNVLYRGIFQEEPPVIHGHPLHVAIELLERICILLTENSCLTALSVRPSIKA